MSIISCTSPRPSCAILPVSSVTSAPSASFSRAELLAQQPDELAASRCGHIAPDLEGFDCPPDRGVGAGGIGAMRARERLARHGRAHLQIAVREQCTLEPEPAEDVVDGVQGNLRQGAGRSRTT